jgi:hypothetical protein
MLRQMGRHVAQEGVCITEGGRPTHQMYGRATIKRYTPQRNPQPKRLTRRLTQWNTALSADPAFAFLF